MIVLYNILFLLGIVLSFPFTVAKILTSEKRRKTIMKRLGRKTFPELPLERPVWIHALSVGEVLASVPLVKKIRKTRPNRSVVLSVSTIAGDEIAKRLLESDLDSIFFFPYDLLWAVRNVAGKMNPAIFLLVESDIWPNFLYEMKRRQVPTILVNGRLSPRSFSGYRRLSFFMRSVFSNISAICAQTEIDAKRFVALGAVRDKVVVTGNLKFNQPLVSLSDKEISELRASMRIGSDEKVLLAGSTHDGEEAILSRCFKVLKKRFPDLVLVVVPRNPGRAYAVDRMFKQAGFLSRLRTELDRMDTEEIPEAIIVDTIGELRRLYIIANVVFVGKSLVNLGGQNPLEPAALKKPILFGPYMFNFALIAQMLVQEGGAFQVADEEELAERVKRLLSDPERSNRMGEAAYKVFRMHGGAMEKTLRVVERFLQV